MGNHLTHGQSTLQVSLFILTVSVFVHREAAKECRRKKKEYVRCLENRVAVLENQNRTLIDELKSLKELYCQKDLHSWTEVPQRPLVSERSAAELLKSLKDLYCQKDLCSWSPSKTSTVRRISTADLESVIENIAFSLSVENQDVRSLVDTRAASWLPTICNFM